MKLQILVLLAVLSVILFAACKTSVSKEHNRFENSVIEMKKEECYGTCPVYSITIKGTGAVKFEGQKHVKNVGSFEKQLSSKQISKLFNAFECANFPDFHSEYTAEVSDLPTTWITFEHRGFKKQIKDYYNAPEELKKLEKMVEDIALNDEGWKKK